MKKTIENIDLTKNFSIYEFIEPKFMPSLSIEMNWKYINNMSDEEKTQLIKNIKQISGELQDIRDDINAKFKVKNDNKEIRILVLCGLRCPEWEKHRKRDGSSQHVLAWTADFCVDNVADDDLYNEIMKYIYDSYDKMWKGGLASFFGDKKKIDKLIANKNLELASQYKKRPWRFIHLDCRNGRERWSY